jgi:hypothetical protein
MPDEVRTMALKWLAAAEAAEMDAMVMSELTAGLGMEFQMAGQFLTHLRKRRGDSNT